MGVIVGVLQESLAGSSTRNSAISSAEVATNASTIWSSVNMARSEPFWPQQRVGQVKQQAHRDEGSERIIESHGDLLLTTVRRHRRNLCLPRRSRGRAPA